MRHANGHLEAIGEMQKQLYTIESILDVQLTKQEQLR